MNILISFQKVLYIVAGFFLITGLQGCGVSTQETPPGNTTTNIVDLSFSTNMLPAGLTERFDLPMQSDNDSVASQFDFEWEVESSDPYSVRAHISTDSSLVFSDIDEGGDDQIFLLTQCGSDSLAYICDSIGSHRCAIAYEPIYSTVEDPMNPGEVTREVNPGPDAVLGTSDDFFVVALDQYYIRCPDGAASVSEANITLRMLGAGFPAASLNNYIVVRVCNEAEDSCQTTITAIQVLDAIP